MTSSPLQGDNYVGIEPPESASKDIPLSKEGSLASPPVSCFKSQFVHSTVGDTLKFEENPEYKAYRARCHTKEFSACFAKTVLEEQHENGKNVPLIASKEKVGNDVDAESYARIKRGENISDHSPPHLSFNGRRENTVDCTDVLEPEFPDPQVLSSSEASVLSVAVLSQRLFLKVPNVVRCRLQQLVAQTVDSEKLPITHLR